MQLFWGSTPMRLTATLALVFCASASAQITVVENATRAKLVNNSTSVFLTNGLSA